MKDEDKTKEQLISEVAELRQRVAELDVLETQHSETEKQLCYHANLLERV